jgi:hypothetical protein
MPGLDETKQFVPLKIAVLTISDTRSMKDDKSGALLVQRIVAAGITSPSAASSPTTSSDPRPGESLDRRPGDRRHHHHRRHRLHRPRRDAGSDRTAVREEDGRLLGAVPGDQLSRRSAPRRSSRAPPRALPARPTSSACRARPAPARTPGTRFWCTSSIIATGRATSSRSCRGSTSTCAGRRRRARRFDVVVPRQRVRPEVAGPMTGSGGASSIRRPYFAL